MTAWPESLRAVVAESSTLLAECGDHALHHQVDAAAIEVAFDTLGVQVANPEVAKAIVATLSLHARWMRMRARSGMVTLEQVAAAEAGHVVIVEAIADHLPREAVA